LLPPHYNTTPKASITHQITIAEPKPRRRDFNLTPEFLDYKKQVIDALGVVL
jgi:hypothetical protein